MIYTSDVSDKGAALHVAQLMSAAARTAPKSCGVDAIETLVLDGADKDTLTAVMRELGQADGKAYFIRDAGNIDDSHCIVLVGVKGDPRGWASPWSLDCGLCGIGSCAETARLGTPCAMVVTDLGIALGSAASVAMDHRIDNRILYTAGFAAMKLKLLPDDVKVCFGIGLATKGKNVFFDRPVG